MANQDQAYLDLLKKIMTEGNDKNDRTGTGTRSLFGAQMRFDLSQGFPILTTKRVPFGLIKSELLWFLRGDTNIRFLLEHKNHIWDEWAFKNWVTSPEYQGPDMTDFGLRSQKDPGFKAVYDEEMQKFCQRILDEAGPNYRVHKPETWPEQCRLAFLNQWSELKEWQGTLRGGRKE